MGAFVTYLHLAHGARNFFVLAPNLTIYSKLIADFTPNTPKYVFKGIAEFAVEPPQVITGDNYDATLLDQLAPCRINIFNISKINSEVRGGNRPDSPLRVQAVEIPAEELQRRVVTVESSSILAERLGVAAPAQGEAPEGQPALAAPLFPSEQERSVAAAALQAIEGLSGRPAELPGSALLRRPDVQARVVKAVRENAEQFTFDGMGVDVERVVATVCDAVADATIDIPRVLVVPIGKVESGYSPFTLDLSSVRWGRPKWRPSVRPPRSGA